MNFDFNDSELQQCQVMFNSLPPEERLFMTHYELAQKTRIKDSTLWKRFLLDTRVTEWINQELTLFKAAQLRKLVKNATDNDRSVGAAQMLTALNKTFDTDTQKEGNVFIYSYVPMNVREQTAPNTQILDHDIFKE